MNNSAQIEYWNAKPGEQWTRNQDALDTLFQDVSHRLLEMAVVKSGMSILDVGCGTGGLSLDLAKAVGVSGRVDAIDVSESMLSLARERARNFIDTPIEFHLADAQVFDLASRTIRYDLIISRFGVMFFDDPVAAFQNLLHSAKSGTRTVFAAWSTMEENPWFKIPREITVNRLGDVAPSSPTAPGPTAFAHRGSVSEILKSAGYATVNSTLETVSLNVAGNTDDAAILACDLGPVVRIAREKGATKGDLVAIRKEVSSQFEKYVSGSRVVVPAKINFFECIKG